MPASPPDLATIATLAALLEASASKPGNVTPGRPFRDMSYEDFLVSAVAAGAELGRAGERSLGETVLAAVRATRRWSRANTNLGIILLLTPLARAAARRGASDQADLRKSLAEVLRASTIEDARSVYLAIREAAPGGLGAAGEQDVHSEPTVTLQEAMRLAVERDAVAAEYASNFQLTFERGVPALRAALEAGVAWCDATVETFLALLALRPDTLIARKVGDAAAAEVSRLAAEVLRAGGTRTEAGRAAMAAFDADLRDPQNSRNPGTTADLTAATLFVVLLEGGWNPDRPRMARAQ
jgi:triphosphoribosyl-dephospho-CoA synthase